MRSLIFVSAWHDKLLRQAAASEVIGFSRGGKATAIWTMSLAVFVIVGGLLLALELRKVVSPPPRPGTTSATNRAGQVELASPGAPSASAAPPR